MYRRMCNVSQNNTSNHEIRTIYCHQLVNKTKQSKTKSINYTPVSEVTLNKCGNCHTVGLHHYRKQYFYTPLPHRGPTPLWEAVLLHTTATPPASTSTGSSASPHHCRDDIAPRVRNHTFTDGVFILCATVATWTLGREFMVSTKTDFRQERRKNLFLQR